MAARNAPVYVVTARPERSGPGFQLDLQDRLLSFKFEDSEGSADKLTLTLDNYDLLLFDDPAFRKGMRLDVTWGYPGQMAPTRTTVVTKITGGTTITVEARAMSVALNTVVKSRQFAQGLTRSQIARKIAAEYGYKRPGVDLHVDETTVRLSTTNQARLTDAQYLQRMANLEGFRFYIDQDGFHFKRRRLGQAPAKTLIYFVEQQRGDIISFSIENDVTAKPGRTKVMGRDPVNKKDVEGEASNTLLTGQAGLTTFRDVIDEESASTVNDVAVPGGPTTLKKAVGQGETRPTSATDSEVAKAQARGKFDAVHQTAVKMKVTIVGDPTILAKSVIRLEGFGKRLSGPYYVRKVSHSGTEQGYTCELELVSDGHSGYATESKVAKGLRLNDSGEKSGGTPNKTTTVDGAALEAVDKIDAERSVTQTQYKTFRGRSN